MWKSRPLSLTSRLTLWYAFSSISLVLISTFYLYWSLVRELDYRDEQLITGKLEAIRTLLVEQPGHFEALRRRVEMEWPTRLAESSCPTLGTGLWFLGIQQRGQFGQSPHW